MDADFDAGWAQVDSYNSENMMSHSGYVITYAVCTVLWCSKLHTEISLIISYIMLIQAMGYIIPVMALMKEISYILDIHPTKQEVFYKVF